MDSSPKMTSFNTNPVFTLPPLACPHYIKGFTCGKPLINNSDFCEDCMNGKLKMEKEEETKMAKLKKEEEKAKKQKEAEQEKTKKEQEKTKKEAEEKQNKEKAKKSAEEASEQYQLYKEEFEDKFIMVDGSFYKIETNGTFKKIKKVEMENILANKVLTTYDEKGRENQKPFFKDWLADKNRVDFEDIKFYPPGFEGEEGEGCYNLWNGFQIEKQKAKEANELIRKFALKNQGSWTEQLEDGTITMEEVNKIGSEYRQTVENSFNYDDAKIAELVKPVIDHINFITDNQAEFMLKWLAHIIQCPGQKTEVAVLIRDMGSLFTKSGGIGKNLFIDFFGKKILGSRYYHVVSENRELFEDFNTAFNGKLLVFVEEAGGQENFQHKNDMKSKITKKDISIQGKGDNRFTTSDFCNYIFTTNNANPLPIDERRFAVFDSLTTKRGDTEYFENLAKKLSSFETCWAFYLYLKNLNTWDTTIKIQNAIPNTKARNDLIRVGAPAFKKWLADFSTLVFLKERRTATDIYNNFCSWYRMSREGTEANIMKQREFFNKLTTESEAFNKCKTKLAKYYTADLDFIITNLKRDYLLPADYSLAEAEAEHEATKI